MIRVCQRVKLKLFLIMVGFYLVGIQFLSSSYLVPICFVSVRDDMVLNVRSVVQDARKRATGRVEDDTIGCSRCELQSVHKSELQDGRSLQDARKRAEGASEANEANEAMRL